MDLKEKILGILINILWLLLGAFLNIFYPSIFSFRGLLPNFFLIFSIILIFDRNFLNIAPFIIVISVVDSIWRGINPGINLLSLLVSSGFIYLIFYRLWSNKSIIVISIFLATIVYFLASYLLIYINRIGTLSFDDALNFGVIQGIYNTIWGAIILLLFKRYPG
jgi:hypothetical protein